jgi:hypothetical protein
LGLEGKMSWMCSIQGQHYMLPYLSMKESSLFCFFIMISSNPWCFGLCYGNCHQKVVNE